MGIILFQIDLAALIILERVTSKTGRQTHFYECGNIKYCGANNIMENKDVLTLSDGSDEDVPPRRSARSNHTTVSDEVYRGTIFRRIYVCVHAVFHMKNKDFLDFIPGYEKSPMAL